MSGLIQAFDVLEGKPDPHTRLIVLVGDEPFLKRLVLARLKSKPLADDSLTELAETAVQWRDVIDELSARSLFSAGDRVILIRNADDFVSNYRGQLENFCEDSSVTGRLILELNKLPSNTRLYAAAVKCGTVIECRLPQSASGKSTDMGRVRKWLRDWAKRTHRVTIDSRGIEAILGLVGTELGLIDQELAKLALFVEANQTVPLALIERVVDGWRQKSTWDMLEAAASGKTHEAMSQLDRLLQSGEHPTMLFGSISWFLRRFAAATRVVQRQERAGKRVDLSAAALEGGFRQWPEGALDVAIGQLKQLGRDRAGRMYGWLLETDLALKGSHSSPDRARLAIEKLILQMAKRSTR
jgi:DNA polymerase-3 subunit delta